MRRFAKGPLITTTALFAAFAGFVPMVATAAKGQPECLRQLSEIETRQTGIRDHMRGDEVRNLKTLRAAAIIFARQGKDDACEEVVEGIGDILEERREQLVDKGVMLDVDEAARVRRLDEAVPVTGLTDPVRASDVIGTNLVNRKGEHLGRVEDVILEPGGADITHLLVTTGGFLGIGKDKVAVPLGRVAITKDRDTLVMAMTQDHLEKAPKVESDDMREVTNTAWREKNDAFYGAPKGD